MRHLYSQSTTMSSKTTTNVANLRLVGLPCGALLFARNSNVGLVLSCYLRADTSLSVQLATKQRVEGVVYVEQANVEQANNL